MPTAVNPAVLYDRHTQEFLDGSSPTAVARAAGPTANRADATRWLRGADTPDRLQRSRLARSKQLRRGRKFNPRWGRLWGVELWTGIEETDQQVSRWLEVYGDWGGDTALAEELGVDARTVRQWFHGEKRSRRASEVDALVAAAQDGGSDTGGSEPVSSRARPPMRPASRAVSVGPAERRALQAFARDMQAAAEKLASALEERHRPGRRPAGQ